MPVDPCLPGAASANVDLLEWDSEFWGFRVAQVRGHVLDAPRLGEVDRFCRWNDVAVLFFLAGADDPASTRAAEEAGFHFVDVRVTLRASTSSVQQAPAEANGATGTIRVWTDADLENLRRIARDNHQTTRFFADSTFPRDRCRALYETWIARSCAGYADAVLVAEDGGNAIGYVTCHLPREADQAGQIGLVAIAEHARGHGFASRLLAAARRWFNDAGVPVVTVVTQGRNPAALRMYERSGFTTDRLQFWYHKWYRPVVGTT